MQDAPYRPRTKGRGLPIVGEPWVSGFWKRVDQRMPDECWPWTAAADAKKGYGRYTVAGKVEFAHRVSYALAVGPIPPGLVICHRCDNPPCVNPFHLFLGTKGDNNADAHAKSRLAQDERTGRFFNPDGPRPELVLLPTEHGEIRMYRRGCRCEKCRAANATEKRAWARKNRAHLAAYRKRRNKAA